MGVAHRRGYYDELREHPLIAADPQAPRLLTLLEDRTLEHALDEAVKSLTGDLREVSSRCGLLTCLRIRSLVKDQDRSAAADRFYATVKTVLEPIMTEVPEPNLASAAQSP